MVAGGGITRIPLARDPNWKVSNPDDVKSEWYQWEKIEPTKVTIDGKEHARLWAIDSTHLTAEDKNAYAGGIVWTEYASVMGTPYPTPIEEYDPVRHAVRLAGPYEDPRAYKPVPHCRYFLENLPRFLDAPGEYYFVQQGPLAGRLYVRLPREQDPNRVAIEIAERLTIVDIREQSHIHISGLTFRFQNVINWYDPGVPGDAEADPACVKATGACRNIRVANCKFEHIVRAFLVASGGQGIADEIAFTDNDIQHADYGPIHVQNRGGTPPAGNLYRLEILRNRLYEVGLRPLPLRSRARDSGDLRPSAGDRGQHSRSLLGCGTVRLGGKGGAGLDWGGRATEPHPPAVSGSDPSQQGDAFPAEHERLGRDRVLAERPGLYLRQHLGRPGRVPALE